MGTSKCDGTHETIGDENVAVARKRDCAMGTSFQPIRISHEHIAEREAVLEERRSELGPVARGDERNTASCR